MKNKIVGTVMLVIVAIAVYIMTGCTDSQEPDHESVVRAQANREWNGMDQLSRDIVCDIYLTFGEDDQEGFRKSALSTDTDEVAWAKIDIMSEDC